MKALSTAETKFTSGGFVRAWPAPQREGLLIAATEAAPALQIAAASDDAQRRMAPAFAVLANHLPSLRFDADRIAPSGIDEDTYNGINDQG